MLLNEGRLNDHLISTQDGSFRNVALFNNISQYNGVNFKGTQQIGDAFRISSSHLGSIREDP